MRSLFLKLFFSFLLTMFLAASTMAILANIQRPDPRDELRRQFSNKVQAIFARHLNVSGVAAVAIFENQGSEALADFLNTITRSNKGHSFLLLKADGTPLTDHTIPAGGVELARSALHEEDLQFLQTETALLAAQPVSAEGGHSYVVLGSNRTPKARWLSPKERNKLLRILAPHLRHGGLLPTMVLLLAAALVCLLLARSLTSPIRKLRNATQRISSGDYTARVGSGLGRPGNEIADLGRDFDVMARRTERLIHSQKRLLRDISHELRSPLARLNVALELVRQNSTPEAQSPLERITIESDRLNELIGQLLTLTLLESGVEKMETEEISLVEVVMAVSDDASFEGRSQNKDVTTVSMEALTIQGSGEMIRRAVENVIRNALHYTAEDTKVEIRLFCRNNGALRSAVIQVRDHGPGVPDKAFEEIFKPFYRVGEARERHNGGTGIGLAIARRAIQLHGGAITAANAVGGGLEVEISLPL